MIVDEPVGSNSLMKGKGAAWDRGECVAANVSLKCG